MSSSKAKGAASSRKQKEGSNSSIKRRTTRACDHCRRMKSKCEGIDGSCVSCVMQGLECNFSAPTAKRGPAKGYLHALESHCHAVEALLGILLSLPDRRAITLLTELSDDPYARTVLDQVNASAFGYRGRELREPKASASTDASTITVDYDDPFKHGPTNDWQDAVIDRFKSKGGGDNIEPFGRMSSVTSTPSTLTRYTSDSAQT